MKLLRAAAEGMKRPAMPDGAGAPRDLSGVAPDSAATTLRDQSRARLRALDANILPVADGSLRLGPCVGSVGKNICIGLNYSDHAAQTGSSVPPEPIFLPKSPKAACGPDDTVLRPRGSEKTDWEAEPGVIIGTKARDVSDAGALSHVAGNCRANDEFEPAFQFERGGQWTKGKPCDTFARLGACLVTRNEVADPQDLAMWSDVDGHRSQNGSPGTLVFGVAHLVSYVSQVMTPMPGDVILAGTPCGVGLGQKPPRDLKAGQMIELGIAGLGVQSQVPGQA